MSKQTKIWLIIAASLIIIGGILFGGVMTTLNWDFTKLSTVKYETNEYTLTNQFHNLSITTNTANITFVLSKDTAARVVCYEETALKHSVTVKNDTLTIQINDSRKWSDYIGINFGSPKITVYLPETEYGAICIKNNTGKIQISDMHTESLDLSVTTGAITVSNVTCQNDVHLQVSTGKATLSDLQCSNLTTTGNTGNLHLTNVIAAKKLSVERTTGNVKLDGCDAAQIFIQTDTGNITGSLLTGKTFTAHTDTGRIDVPQSTSGGKCQLQTDTGDIKITIQPF